MDGREERIAIEQRQATNYHSNNDNGNQIHKVNRNVLNAALKASNNIVMIPNDKNGFNSPEDVNFNMPLFGQIRVPLQFNNQINSRGNIYMSNANQELFSRTSNAAADLTTSNIHAVDETQSNTSETDKRPRCPKILWSIIEDEELRKLVLKSQERTLCPNWKLISAQLRGRSPKQCRERWSEYLNPEIDSSPFTADEDADILAMQEHVGNKWSVIANNTGSKCRTATAIKVRWHFLNRKKLKASEQPMKHEKRVNEKVSDDDAQSTSKIAKIDSVENTTPNLVRNIVGRIPEQSVNNHKLNFPPGAVAMIYATIPGWPENQGFYLFPSSFEANQ